MAEIARLKDGGRTLELLCYDFIGVSFFGDGLTARLVRQSLSAAGNIDTIELKINSPGGNVSDGTAIYTVLHQHPARVVVDIDGHALSAASLIAMAGDDIRMPEGSMMMIHEAWGVTQGPAEDHDSTAAQLRKLTDAAAGVYAARTGQTKEEILKLLAAETWLPASEAKDLGFATEVLPAKTGAQACWDPRWSEAAKTLFKRIPDEVRNAPRAEMRGRPPEFGRDDETVMHRPPLRPAALGKLASERPRTLLGRL